MTPAPRDITPAPAQGLEGATPPGSPSETPPAANPGGSTSLLAVLLLSFGILLAIFLLLRRQYERRPRGADARSEPSTPGERLEEIRHRAEAADPLRTLMVESADLARRMGAELDNKAERLEQLLAEAEDRIAAMERGMGHPSAPGGDARPGNGAEPGEAAEPAPAQHAPPPSPPPARDPFVARVHELADAGLKPVEIARRLNQGVGKVELVLSLRAGTTRGE